MPLSRKQLEFIDTVTKGHAKINIAHGSVRGGKTFATASAFVEMAIMCPDNHIIMIGNSFSTIVDNVVKLIKDELYPGYCVWEPGNQLLKIGRKEIRVIGANDERAVRAIQGNTHSLAYVDEMTTIPLSFLEMLETRLSNPWSRLIATCNPSSPLHMIKTKYIDSTDKDYTYSLHFEIDDNPVLDERTKRDLKTKYTGLFYKRYILGLWVMAEGSIYSDFDRKTHVLERWTAADEYIIGLDYGSTNAFAAVLIGFKRGHTPRFYVEKEYYWDSAKTFRQKSPSEYADDIIRFMGLHPVAAVYCDPSATPFILELKRKGIKCIEANNDVFPGIQFVSNLISNHQLCFHPSCTNTLRELEMYVWDSKKALRGEEEPVKQNDHAMDALRYALYTRYGNKMDLDGGKGKIMPDDPRPMIDPRTMGFRGF